MQRSRFLFVAVLLVGAALGGPAGAMFANPGMTGISVGFPDVCKVPLDAASKLPTTKPPTKIEIDAVKNGLTKVGDAAKVAEEYLSKSKEPKAKIEEARKVLGQVRLLQDRAQNAIESTPKDDKTGALRKRLLPILKELHELPYPQLLRDAHK